jgi:hypothetical protein
VKPLQILAFRVARGGFEPFPKTLKPLILLGLRHIGFANLANFLLTIFKKQKKGVSFEWCLSEIKVKLRVKYV